MTATSRNTSLENKYLRSCDYFAMIPSWMRSTTLATDFIKCDNFTLLFYIGWHGSVTKCVPHVQHTYFNFFIQPIKFLICGVVVALQLSMLSFLLSRSAPPVTCKSRVPIALYDDIMENHLIFFCSPIPSSFFSSASLKRWVTHGKPPQPV